MQIPNIFFRRGAVYRGIYLPSLSGKLQDERLEVAYQKYSHRQRQKSLLLVNAADLCLKVRVARCPLELKRKSSTLKYV